MRFSRVNRGVLSALGLLFVVGAPGVLAADVVVPRMLLLDGALVGGDIVAVGERGAILRSTDQARTWQSTASPATATLTGVSFAPAPTAQHGWAVGHEALILATLDGGRTWSRQYQGEDLQDSFLDVLALDLRHVIAVGAYGLCVETKDGGATWTRRKLSDDDSHYNRISLGPSGTLYVAGESGTLLRSADAGVSWTPLDAPYEGSFYGVLPLDRHRLLAHGLRGQVHLSSDDGKTWERVATPQPLLIASATVGPDNVIVLAGAARSLLVSHDQGRTVAPHPQAPGTAIAELLALPNGNVLALGEAGASVVPMNAPPAAAAGQRAP